MKIRQKNKNLDSKYLELDKKRNKKICLWLIVSVIFFILSIILIFIIYEISSNIRKKTLNPLKSLSIQLDEQTDEDRLQNINLIRRNIDGVYVERGKENLFPIAIIIDNHPDARPQFGLSQANLVYEVLVEGVTTRFLAIYADGQNIKEIGPVRSARPYFIDWINEFSALFVHCGGSPEALVRIARNDIIDMNEFYKGKYFWRDNSRLSPHNVITSTENLRSYLEQKNIDEKKYFSWQFKNDNSTKKTPDEPANIVIPKFAIIWKYNQEKNDYQRRVNNQAHKDAGGTEIRAKNIIIIYAQTEVIDEKLRLKIKTIGTGRAVICLDGTCQKGNWRKNNKSARMRFYDKNDEEFKFNAGTTWIEVVRQEGKIKFE